MFNEVFFDNVRVPAKNIVGELNRGWYVGTTTLDFERSSIGSAVGLTHTNPGGNCRSGTVSFLGSASTDDRGRVPPPALFALS